MQNVPTAWDYQPNAGPGEAWFEPADGPITQRVALIEPPIRLRSEPVGGQWT